MTDYTEDYFLRGKELGLSNYEDYRWLPEQTIPFAEKVIKAMDMKPHSSCLDFGCARGYLVKALRQLGIFAYGCDISDWAIENCDPDVKHLVSKEIPNLRFTHTIAKDVLEHIEEYELSSVINKLDLHTFSSMLFIVPLAEKTGGPYIRVEDEMDPTHKIAWTLEDWYDEISFLVDGDVYASYSIKGVKPNAEAAYKSTGFILIKK